MEEITAESISSLKAGGLRVLWQGPSPEVDVVAVHGLGANPDWAWVRKVRNSDDTQAQGEAPSKIVNWLSDPDMLPSKLPNTRIMTFNYLSKWHANAPVQRLALCAEQMLNSLDLLRKEDPGTDSRPLMFIGHSFGGIVIEQMIVYANGDDRFRHISAATSGVMFLGSPFHGSHATGWAQMIAWTGQKIGLGSSDAILKALQEDSKALSDLRHRFCELLLRRPVPVCCSFEQYPTDYGARWGFTFKTMVVAENSACLDGHLRWQLPTDHLKLNKFEGPKDQAYIDVSKILVKWVREKLEMTKAQNRILSEIENQCLQDLFLTDPQDDLAAMKPRGQRVAGTCEWILTRKEYKRWLVGEHTRLLYLTGRPGIGKTTIATRLTEELAEKAKQDGRITFVYYFCDSKDQNRRTASTVLRGLLLQTLRRRPALFKLILPEYKQKGKQWFDSFDGLRRIFCSMLDDPDVGKTYILVDALDECEENCRVDLLQCLESIASISQVIVTSRMTVEIEEVELKSQKRYPGRQCPRLCSDFIHVDSAAINKDLSNFIEVKIEELPARFSVKTKDMIKDALIDRAGGTFIWVSLVLMDISKAKRSDAVSQKLHKLPRDLNEIYVRILRDIDDDDVSDARFILQCVTAAMRPLTVQELTIAWMIGKGSWIEDHAPRPDDISEYENDWKCCGPILRLDSDGETRTVNLIHQSAKDFLLDRSIGCCEKVTGSLFEESIADLSMFDACRDFLTKTDFDSIATKTHLYRYDSLHDDLTPRDHELEYLSLGAAKQPFLSYCLDHWRDHAIAAEDQLFKSLPCIQKNAPRRQAFMTSWLALAIQHGRLDMVKQLLLIGVDVNSDHALYRTPLYSAIASVVQLLLAQPELRIGNHLSIAADFMNISIVALLLASQKCVVNDMADALLTAAKYHSGPIVEQLLLAQPRVIPDLVDLEDRALLSHASEAGSEVVMKLLLNQSQVMADRRDIKGRTPLSWAASSGKEACVQLLLSRDDVSCDSRDSCGRTPLSYAAGGFPEDYHWPSPRLIIKREYGHCVSLLLSQSGVQADSRDLAGRTPLSWAASSGNGASVNLLLSRSEVLADSRDSHGRTPLSYAAEEPAHFFFAGTMNGMAMIEKCMRLLLSRNEVVADSEDHSGRRPLSYAALCKVVFNLVKLLLSRHDVSADHIDGDGYTPLLRAAQGGCGSTLQFLLSRNDVVADCCDKEGRTPLILATQARSESCVRLLLTRSDVSLTARDRDGRTALSWASEQGFFGAEPGICAGLLLMEDCSLVETCDNKEWTPLHFAASAGYNAKIMKLLTKQPNATIDSENDDGQTPLSLEVRKEPYGVICLPLIESLRSLIDAGANINHHSVITAIHEVQDRYKCRPAYFDRDESGHYLEYRYGWEFYAKWPDVLQFLVKRGAKI